MSSVNKVYLFLFVCGLGIGVLLGIILSNVALGDNVETLEDCKSITKDCIDLNNVCINELTKQKNIIDAILKYRPDVLRYSNESDKLNIELNTDTDGLMVSGVNV